MTPLSKRLCEHRTQLDDKRIVLHASGLKARRYLLTPAIMEDFCEMLIRENGVFEKLFAEKKVAGIFVWDPDLTAMITEKVRRALPARNQRIVVQ